ncbi:MAG: Signal transduction histidine-protein kinase AtoS [Chlamydiales bacterium]|nr:Signal transduction histidine-protein kinase AtoS [Chlamydiales bacterium]
MQGNETDFHLQVALYARETERLEQAHQKLEQQFELLRSKLETSHQTLEQIISHMSDGLLFISQEGIITLYNQAAARITEIPQEGIVGTSFWDHFSDALFGFPLANALKNDHTPGRILLSLSNGREIEVAPTRIPEKGLLLLLNDRTELQQLEKSLQQSDRLKELGEMAATLAHEIRNPLGGIEGFSSLLKRDLKEASHQKMIEAILTGCHTLNTLVTNVLDYARPLTLHFVPTDLAPLIQETVELAQASGISCKARIEGKRKASIDPKRMQLVWLNLIHNGSESGAETVEIILTKEGSIQVRDTGEGMTPEQLEKIFTPFFTTKTTGTGLGLSEVDKVMRAHGGSITIDSNVGKGTCITLSYGH